MACIGWSACLLAMPMRAHASSESASCVRCCHRNTIVHPVRCSSFPAHWVSASQPIAHAWSVRVCSRDTREARTYNMMQRLSFDADG